MFTILCNTTDTLIHRTAQASEVRNFLTREGRNPKAFAIYDTEPEMTTGIRGDAWLRHYNSGEDLASLMRQADGLANRIHEWVQAHQDAEYILRRQLDMAKCDLRTIIECAQPKTRTWKHPINEEDIPF